jgi:hypothetical protein
MPTYYLKSMCILNEKWVEENGDCWASGLVEVMDVPGEMFSIEYTIPPLHTEDWNRFSDYLDTKLTRRVYSLQELIEDYESRNPPLRWLTEEK